MFCSVTGVVSISELFESIGDESSCGGVASDVVCSLLLLLFLFDVSSDSILSVSCDSSALFDVNASDFTLSSEISFSRSNNACK